MLGRSASPARAEPLVRSLRRPPHLRRRAWPSPLRRSAPGRHILLILRERLFQARRAADMALVRSSIELPRRHRKGRPGCGGDRLDPDRSAPACAEGTVLTKWVAFAWRSAAHHTAIPHRSRRARPRVVAQRKTGFPVLEAMNSAYWSLPSPSSVHGVDPALAELLDAAALR